MNGEEIRKALREKNLSFAAIGRALGHSTGEAVSRTCHRKANSRAVANLIANRLGLSVSEIFPDKPEYADEPVAVKRMRAETEAREAAKAAGLVA